LPQSLVIDVENLYQSHIDQLLVVEILNDLKNFAKILQIGGFTNWQEVAHRPVEDRTA